MRSTVSDDSIEFRWIDRQADLDAVVRTLCGVPRYALDTEVHRERTYVPKLALIQIAWHGEHGQELVLVDPLAVDVGALGAVFETDALTAYRRLPLAVVLPETTEQVSAVLTYCNSEGL